MSRVKAERVGEGEGYGQQVQVQEYYNIPDITAEVYGDVKSPKNDCISP